MGSSRQTPSSNRGADRPRERATRALFPRGSVDEPPCPDIFCFHAGTTRGGLVGYDSGETIADTARRTEEVYAAVREIEADTILVGHGAAMETPEDAQSMLDHTSGHGFWTGSSTERLPIERAVFEAAQEFAKLKFRDGATNDS